ncbi:ankyrin repeat-containing domain protein [Mycena rebaudengoi]|nr:ankyrin repeat-containing domain protein [Mycena rebaudengoi]
MAYATLTQATRIPSVSTTTLRLVHPMQDSKKSPSRLRGIKEQFRNLERKVFTKRGADVDAPINVPPVQESLRPPDAANVRPETAASARPALGSRETFKTEKSPTLDPNSPTAEPLEVAATKPHEGSKDSVISNISAALAIVEQVGKVIEAAPFVEPIGAILLQFVKVYKQLRDNDGKRDTLLNKVAALFCDIAPAILRLHDNGHAAQIHRLGPDLKEYRGLLENAQRLLSVEHKKIVRILKGDELGAELDALDKQIDLFGARFRTNRLVDLQFTQDKVAEDVTKVLDTVVQRELEDWLNAPDPKEKHTRSYNLRHESTCLWLLQDERFMHWQDHPGELLWIEGSSGTGKTILSSTVIEQLFQDRTAHGRQNRTAIAYFYFDFGDSSKQCVENAIRRLILQISAQCPNPNKTLSHHHQTYSGQKDLTHQQLLTLLKTLLGELGRTYLVLDALDECRPEDHHILVDFVQTVLSWVEVHLHIVVTSQRRAIFTKKLTSLERYSQIVLQEEMTSRDIRMYISSQLASRSELEHWKSNSDLLVPFILKKSAGMFRLAACLLIELSRCFWQEEWEQTLTQLPNDLFGIYDRFLGAVPSSAMVYVEAVFRWIVFAADPMTLEELADAVASDFSDPAQYVYKPSRREGNKIAIPKWLDGLIVIKNNDRGEDSVALAHASVQDYLLSKQFMDKFGGDIDLSVVLSHTFIARICIQYLLHFADHPLNLETFPDYPLASYAAHSWFYHLKRCHDQAAFSAWTILLLESGSAQYRSLNYLHDIDESFRSSPHWHRSVASPLYMCSKIGYRLGVKFLLANGADAINAPGRTYSRNALQAAASEGHTEIVRLLIENGADVNTPGPEFDVYGSALETAASGGHLDTLVLLLESGAEFGSALTAAAERGHLEIVRLLVKMGGDINAGWDKSALLAACEGGYTEIFNFLLENHPDINAVSYEYGTALQAACGKGRIDFVRRLLDLGADVDLGSPLGSGANPLQVASCYGHIEIVRLLLEHNANPNVGMALYAAAESEDDLTDIVRLLLEKGADPNRRSPDGDSPLRIACLRHHREIVRLLIEHGVDPNSWGKGSALSCATWDETVVSMLLENGAKIVAEDRVLTSASEYTVGIVRLLLDHGAAVHSEDAMGALRSASSSGNIEIVKLLVQRGLGGDLGPALRAAASGHHLEIIQFLLASDADVNVPGDYGTVLHVACRQGFMEIVQVLLDHGADSNTAGGEYANALQATASCEYSNFLLHRQPEAVSRAEYDRIDASGRTEIVQMLLQKSAHVNAKGGKYGSALQAASKAGHMEIACVLLENGADVHALGGKYGTALSAAVANNHMDMICLLLDNGADINSSDLQTACSRGHTKLVEFLLWKGADINAAGGELGSALQAAAANGHADVVQILLDNGARVNAAGGLYGGALQAVCGKEPSADAWYDLSGYWAEVRRRVKIVRLLLKNGAAINAASVEAGTALLQAAACSDDYTDIVRILLENGANINEVGGTCGSALQIALHKGQMEIARLLIHEGADVNMAGGENGNALQIASEAGSLEMVQLLVERGADLNAASGKYSSALQAAVGPVPSNYSYFLNPDFRSDRAAIVRLLLEKGAKVHVAGEENGSVLQMALQNGHTEIVQILHEVGEREEERVEDEALA